MQRVDFDELEIDFGDGETQYWQGKPFTGMAYELWPDGTLRSEIEHQDGLRHNIARDWYPGSQIEGETTYYKGTLYGPEREWDEAGVLRKETVYEYGYWRRKRAWNEEGQITQDEVLEPGSSYHTRLLKARARYDKYLEADYRAWLKALVEQG